ncbi:MAG: hypothetical protein QGG71_06035 [Pirellulaceae bacterium]|jgi:hypothetical protein|nr:hypothetical protein [Pirellulaceae bacterium]
MISVKIRAHQSEGVVEVGMIEFRDLKIWKRLDSGFQFRTAKRPLESVPFSYRCVPTNRLSVDELEKLAPSIADLLSLGFSTGETGAFTWQTEEVASRSDSDS